MEYVDDQDFQANLKKAKPINIGPGQCGFKGCEEERLGGYWHKGGSYMCKEHRDLLMPIRVKINPDYEVPDDYYPREANHRQERN